MSFLDQLRPILGTLEDDAIVETLSNIPIIADDLTSLISSLNLDALETAVDDAIAVVDGALDPAARAAAIAAALDDLDGITASATGTVVSVGLTAATNANVASTATASRVERPRPLRADSDPILFMHPPHVESPVRTPTLVETTGGGFIGTSQHKDRMSANPCSHIRSGRFSLVCGRNNPTSGVARCEQPTDRSTSHHRHPASTVAIDRERPAPKENHR